MMSKKAFILSEQSSVTAELAGLAARSGYSAAAIVFSQEEAEKITKSGVSQILVLSGPSQRPEAYVKCIARLLQEKECDLLLAAAAPRTRELAASITGFLGCPLVNDAMDLNAAFVLRLNKIRAQLTNMCIRSLFPKLEGQFRVGPSSFY